MSQGDRRSRNESRVACATPPGWKGACAACPTGDRLVSSRRRSSCCRDQYLPADLDHPLSFTNYRANRPNAKVEWRRARNYKRILSNADVWIAMQATAHFVFWTTSSRPSSASALAYLHRPKFRGHAFWTTIILIPMMLSPAVVGNFWRFLFQPQIGLSNYVVSSSPASRHPPSDARHGTLAPWSIVIVDTWMWTPYVMLIASPGCARFPTTSTRRPRSTAPRNGGSSGRSRYPWRCLSSCWRCFSAASRTSRCSTWSNLLTGGGPGRPGVRLVTLNTRPSRPSAPAPPPPSPSFSSWRCSASPTSM